MIRKGTFKLSVLLGLCLCSTFVNAIELNLGYYANGQAATDAVNTVPCDTTVGGFTSGRGVINGVSMSGRYRHCTPNDNVAADGKPYVLWAYFPSKNEGCEAIGAKDLNGTCELFEYQYGPPNLCQGENAIGNPVSVVNGNKYQVEQDYIDPVGTLSFTRFYTNGAWRISFSRHFSKALTAAGSYYFNKLDNGHKIRFEQPNEKMHWLEISDDGQNETPGYEETDDGEVTVYKYNGALKETYESRLAPSHPQRLLKIENMHGVTHTIDYEYIQSENKSITTVIDKYKRKLVIVHILGRLDHIETPDGTTTSYSHDGLNRLSRVTYPDETYKKYHYDSGPNKNRLTGISLSNGVRYASWSYGPKGRATSSKHAGDVDKVTIDYSRFESEGIVRSTNALGKDTLYHVEEKGFRRLLTRTEGVSTNSCLGSNSYITYNDNYWVETKTDELGAVVKTLYNDVGQITEVTRGLSWTDGVGSTLQETAESQRTTTQWINNSPLMDERRYWHRNDIGEWEVYKIEDYEWNSNHYIKYIRVSDPRIPGKEHITNFSYTFHDPEESIIATRTVDGPRTDVLDTVTHEYAPNGNLVKVSNGLGHHTTFTDYTAAGLPEKSVDSNGVVTRFTYDVMQRMKTIVIKHPSGSVDDRHSYIDYTFDGEVERITSDDGVYVLYEYDDARRLSAIVDTEGNKLEYNLDNAGNVETETVKNSSGEVKYVVNKRFDELSRLRKVIQNFGQETDFNYDVSNNVENSVNGKDYPTHYDVDTLNRVTSIFDGQNNETKMSYTADDVIRSVTDARGLETKYHYDGLGNLLSIHSPDTGITTFVYDDAGNVITAIDNKELETTYTYDALNRLTSVSYSNNEPGISYHYDDTTFGNYGIGRLTSIEDKSGITQFYYDFSGALGRKTYSIGSENYELRYTYNKAGRLIATTYPSGRIVNYAYNNFGKVTAISTQMNVNDPPSNVVQQIEYLPFGPIKSYVYGNGVQQSLEYDLDYRLEELIAQGNTSIMDRSYFYDLNNNIEDIADNNSIANELFSYDFLDRLNVADGQYGIISYDYDAVGNRTLRSVDNGTEVSSEVYTSKLVSNQLEKITFTKNGENSTREFAYDGNGNVVKDRYENTELSITYDAAERPVSWSDGLTAVNYIHNALGQRTVKTVANKSQYFHYDDGGRLIAVSTAGGMYLQEVIWFNGKPIAILNNDAIAISNTDIEILSPTASSVYSVGQPIVFSAMAENQGGSLANDIIWHSNIDGVLGSGGSLSVEGLTKGRHIVEAKIVDADGNTLLSKSIVILINNSSPSISRTFPSENNVHSIKGESQEFSVFVRSEIDGIISESSAWSSSLDGNIGSGAEVITELSEGSHTINVNVVDSTGATATLSFPWHVVTESTDEDGDELPDAWEYKYFQSLEQSMEHDDDADGITNKHEYMLALDPYNFDLPNSLDPDSTHDDVALVEKANTVSASSQGWRGSVAYSPLLSNKKYYWEAAVERGLVIIGLGSDYMTGTALGMSPHSYGWASYKNGEDPNIVNNGESIPYTHSYTMGDRVMIAYDPNDGKLWFGLNGIWNGNPSTGQGAQFENVFGANYPAVSLNNGQATLYFHPDKFLYSPPQGYSPSQNLDVDGDGLSDVWEIDYFGSTLEVGTGDFDGDMRTNTYEYLHGTNPASPDIPTKEYLRDIAKVYLDLDEQEGVQVIDGSIYQLHGAYKNGVSLGEAGSGNFAPDYSVKFDGVDDYITLTDTSRNLVSQNTFCVSVWFKLDRIKSASEGTHMLFSNAKTEGENGWFLRVKHDGLYSKVANRPGLFSELKSSPLNANQWYHAALMFDGAVAKLYLDGNLVDHNSNMAASHISHYSDRELLIGKQNKSYEREKHYLEGNVDQVIFFDRALTAEEVSVLSSGH